MIGRWQWTLRRLAKRLWFRASLFSILGVLTALLALAIKQYIPGGLSAKIGSDAVDNILGIIASSMLAVTTFSLSTMVSAYGSATSNVTPRATPLLVEDSTTQNALATFVGSFLFSLVGIIALSTGAYGEQGRVVMFTVTIGVIALIVYTLLRWIDHLARLGRLGETTDRVEHAATLALRDRLKNPNLGGESMAASAPIPSSARLIFTSDIGYVQHLDMPSLASLTKADANLAVQPAIYVFAVPGTFVEPSKPVAATTNVDESNDATIAKAFTIGVRRSFDQDPRFGISVLTEIASRALSPAVNDPGTAIDVLGRGVRLLSIVAGFDEAAADREDRCKRVYVPDINIDDLFDDFFTPIARDGASLIEVGIRLQKALASLARVDDPRFNRAAKHHARLALKRAEHALPISDDKDQIQQLCSNLLKE
ncbi:hypothetical protein AX768_29710 (plasmid) [Burkholderia sp. PAMC 28687]|uniref:DUF2254 domain-containing protein n=1 Tax=Burkholderia sp. PAMC 28687 TaxID=1795874 RepID=UPI000782C685|nr:DUF2254 domain-containing protein [Burkholderia sp. PAMC 28687]AMM18445.1 hypothetical protein AX768_29710 [Burkholderia sp. PAMC 28687]